MTIARSGRRETRPRAPRARPGPARRRPRRCWPSARPGCWCAATSGTRSAASTRGSRCSATTSTWAGGRTSPATGCVVRHRRGRAPRRGRQPPAAAGARRRRTGCTGWTGSTRCYVLLANLPLLRLPVALLGRSPLGSLLRALGLPGRQAAGARRRRDSVGPARRARPAGPPGRAPGGPAPADPAGPGAHGPAAARAAVGGSAAR